MWIGSEAVPLPILDRQRRSIRCRYRNRQRPSFAADSLIDSDVVSAADSLIDSDVVSAADFGSAATQLSLWNPDG